MVKITELVRDSRSGSCPAVHAVDGDLRLARGETVAAGMALVQGYELGGWCFSRKVTKRTDDQGVYQCVSLYVISVFLAQRRLAPAS